MQASEAALARQDLSCTYLAHHELESILIIIIIIIQASEAMAQDLQHQLAEQQTELAAQRSQSASLKHSLQGKTKQHDTLTVDHNNALQVCFYIMYLLMHCDGKLCCCLCR